MATVCSKNKEKGGSTISVRNKARQLDEVNPSSESKIHAKADELKVSVTTGREAYRGGYKAVESASNAHVTEEYANCIV